MAVATLFGKRSTRFRHVYGSPAQKENCYDNIKVSGNAHDSMFCAVNRQYLAVVLECAGGGGFAVLPLQRTGRIDHQAPKVCGHSAPVMDVKWNPFNDQIIASASDDATVKLWEIPKAGLRSDLTRFIADFRGHSRRVAYIEWHPTAENLLLSAGFDHQSILWNCEMAQPVVVSNVHPDVILSLSWNRDGSLFASTCKDRNARVVDPRSGKTVVQWEPHQGTKTTKITFLGDTKQLFTTGFSQFAQRQYGLWDMRNLNQGAIKQDNVDSASGALFPFYDHDTRMVYLAGKGDGNIRYFELTSDAPFVHYLSEYQSPHPQRGLGVMPKLGLDTSKCEIFRFYKLHSNRPYCEPISMIAPRKAETFQEDLYPATAGDKPALSAIEWIGGTNREPILVNIRDPSLAVNSPPTTTSRPVQLSHVPSQVSQHSKLMAPIHPSATLPTEADENKVPQSVKNIRKLVGGNQPNSSDSESISNHQNINARNIPPVASSGSHNSSSSSHSLNSETSNQRSHQPPPVRRDSHQEATIGLSLGRLGVGASEQSLSKGSDSVFERVAQKMERPPSPVAAALEHQSNGSNNQKDIMSNSRQSLGDRSDGTIVVETNPRTEVMKPQSKVSNEKLNVSNGGEHILLQPHPPGGLPPPYHHNIHQIRHDDVSAVAVANVVPHEQPSSSVRSQRNQHPPAPPLSLNIPSEKPVSAGFVVQTAVQSPMTPTNRSTTNGFSHQQENVIPPRLIQKMPNTMNEAHNLYPSQQDHPHQHTVNGINDVPLASPQFRRGATGGNAYQSQNYQPVSNHHGSAGVVRSPSGRSTRPDILEALQEQLSASSRELRGGASLLGPAPQAAHLQLGQVAASGRNSRNMSPAEKRTRNKTIATPDGNQHAFMPAGDFAASVVLPGNYPTAAQRVLQLPAPQGNQNIIYYPIQQSQPPNQAVGTGSRRQPHPPVASRSVNRAQSGASALSPRSHNVAVVDVRDDMAPAIMRPSQPVQQMPVSSPGLNRSQTMFMPAIDSHNIDSAGFKFTGDGLNVMPIVAKGSVAPSIANENSNRARTRDRAHRPRRDLSAAPIVGRHHEDQQRSQPKPIEENFEQMDEITLRNQCRRQKDELRLLRRQCEAKDQVIHRLESELRHMAHQLQQRYGVIGGAGAQALAAVGQ